MKEIDLSSYVRSVDPKETYKIYKVVPEYDEVINNCNNFILSIILFVPSSPLEENEDFIKVQNILDKLDDTLKCMVDTCAVDPCVTLDWYEQQLINHLDGPFDPDAWYAPAGFNRGETKDLLSISMPPYEMPDTTYEELKSIEDPEAHKESRVVFPPSNN